MTDYIVLYNPLSGGGRGEEKTKELERIVEGNIKYTDITKIKELDAFISSLKESDNIIISGGDGTLHRFVNSADTEKIKNPLYFFPSGSGNDFIRDIDMAGKECIVDIKKYISRLPVVTVKGKTYKFINNVSFGLDGYCCEEADKKRESNRKINYPLIALKGLLGGFDRRNAVIEADGREMRFEGVWMVPSMNGRFLGGGIKAAPGQDRLNSRHTVSCVVIYNANRLKCLFSFPGIFKGNHTKKDLCRIFESNSVKVTFDKPAAVQIDGETIRDVLTYTVISE